MKLLLVQTSFLGDTILSTPVIAALKKLYPEAELWLLCAPQSRELLVRDPLLAGIITYDKRGAERGWRGLSRKAAEIGSHRFDRAYALHRSYRSALLLKMSGIPERIGFAEAGLSWLYTRRVRRLAGGHDVFRNLSLLSAETRLTDLSAELRLFAPPSDQVSDEVRSLLDSDKALCALFPGSVWPTKMWHWRNYRELIDKLLTQGLTPLILGSEADAAVGRLASQGTGALQLAGRTTLAETMLLVSQARLVICNDSMALHMASAFKVPTTVVFCSTAPAMGFGPWRNQASVLEAAGLECKPCGRHGWRRCPTGTEACMRGVSAETAWRSALRLLDETA